MVDGMVRDSATRERLARSLAEYYYRRTLGIVCFDPLGPGSRAEMEELHRRKLALARHTLNKMRATRLAPRECEVAAGRATIPRISGQRVVSLQRSA